MSEVLHRPTADSPLAQVTRTAGMVVEVMRQRRFPYAPQAAIRQAQERRIRATVSYARTHVPYYRETMRRLLLEPGDLSHASDLARLPLLEREQLQQDPEYFISDEWPAEKCIELNSGGTTGAPLPIFRDPPALFAQAAHYERMRSVIRRLSGRPGYREAAIVPFDSSTATEVSAFRSRVRLPRSLQVQLRVFSMLRPPAELVDELEGYRPHVISSYGSYLEALFTYVAEHRPQFTAPRVAVYGADSMSSRVRQWTSDALGIEVLSSYGAIEAPHIGFECGRHAGYHLNLDLYPVRLLDAHGGEAEPGSPGEVVVSNLVSRGTVLLNYRLGDVVAMVPQACGCGRSLPLCTYLERRGARWLDFGRGRWIHAQALKLVLRAEREIWRYQLVQETRHEILLRAISSPACERETTASRILEGLRQQLPDDASVRIEFVTDLPRGPSGKVQPILPLARS